MSPPPQASQPAAPPHGQLFTVRVWAEAGEGGRPAWRFKVQHVLSGEARYFNEWESVVEFIFSRSRLVE